MDGATEDEWGGFGRPLFDDPSTRSLKRVGVIDVGSNSIRLVIFDGAARSPAYFYNEKVMAGLGTGMGESGRLHPEGRARAKAALARFVAVARAASCTHLTCVATAAVREAEDGAAFVAEVRRETGLHVATIDGEEEARLSAQGVLLGWPGAYGLICDIGGSSMELAEIAGGRVGRRVSSKLGPLKLASVPEADRGAHIDARLDEMAAVLGPQSDRLFLVGGSWRALARIDMERTGYPLHVLHEYRMQSADIHATAALISDSDPDALRAACGISSTRMALVPLAAEVLLRLLARFVPHDIAVSSYGIREGLLYERMPQALRDRDPLIEACRFAEAKDARLPGTGRRLARFVAPLFPDATPERRRLIRAACLLHDVSWRAHPDYRAEVCFDNATRANLGGLTHAERVYLGLALLHRYSNKREGTRFDALFDLLTEADSHEAEILGRAMRFGAMLWTDSDAEAASLDWDGATLTLRLAAAARPLFGEVAEARFGALAAALSAATQVVDG
ncbi:MAG: Ppx/GppA phosphatase family protein [Shimia sp.]